MKKKNKVNSCWYNSKIPAELFFEILESGDLKGLIINGKPKKKILESSWSKILDEYFTLKEDQQLRLIIRTKGKILKLKLTIQSIKKSLETLDKISDLISEDNKELLKELAQKYQKIGIRINPDQPLKKQILDILTLTVPPLETELAIEEDSLKNLTKGAKSTYMDNLVAIENTVGRDSGQNLTLAKYLALEKSAKKISKSREMNSKKK